MRGRLPPWFKKKMPDPMVMASMRALFDGLSLHTICESALCPNQGDCFSNRTATFLLLGDICTRNCTFCAVFSGKPAIPDPDEARRVAQSIQELGLQYAVITSVTRDDLPCGGAGQFAATIRAIRDRCPDCRVEVLIPDFQGNPNALITVIAAAPDVLNHNLETVPSLYPLVRPQANYRRSLGVLKQSADSGLRTKTGLMLGLGETDPEILRVLEDVLSAGCRLLTLGQYLQPTKNHHPVARFLHPDEFRRWAQKGGEMGFEHVEAGPLVRSSYKARQQAEALLQSAALSILQLESKRPPPPGSSPRR